ncbi:MAG: hypothetical protein A2748_00310 [Candidatus Wildermuthbacteria bacterium RIFCSPHIGHO2_01_FULL_45_20]|uniref:Uncharacterized protein n=1 Tax=Candidatus Wildermuthbacteria bacterium RIFCSPHIGHO2_02_FULL_45_25 TaxID=1802450 RepID=A0A1G2QZP7_9BACT|nr:MAG: hypothetical protein A2748_00310 [Candidatus Wildermuthbacteria bacterium RIFCSPHIGHO2_01_FULL_45_20]OHA65492.1 MAG: hypothetical protein A3C04_02755 [Candidatus Wildermuthbacteria bacterium RIFCSPHIGHO2_02_FULL_45_25]
MSQTILLIICFVSLAGIFFLIGKKIPLLLAFATDNEENFRSFMEQGAKRIAVSSKKGAALSQKTFEKALVKTRAIAARTEMQTGEWLYRLQAKSKARKDGFASAYWDKIKEKPLAVKKRKKKTVVKKSKAEQV